jgi:AcrR family transcriptional regulator
LFPGETHVPRPQNPDLESAVLDAAHKLWKKGGERGLTMRAVARAAGTNTPAVYRRFRDRDDLLRGILQRIRLEIAAELKRASSAEEGCERYLDYALRHPHEYILFYQHNYELQHSPRSRRSGAQPVGQPARDAMRRKLAERLGDSPDDHERMLTVLWMLVHGAAMLLIAKSILPQDAAKARSVFSASVATLLLQASEI